MEILVAAFEISIKYKWLQSVDLAFCENYTCRYLKPEDFIGGAIKISYSNQNVKLSKIFYSYILFISVYKLLR